MENSTVNNTDRSYKQILKSTFIMGGSSVITILLGIVRTKVIALLLGPSGVGLTGIYMSIINLVGTVSGMGIRESGVRQIAGAFGTGDNEIISRTLFSIRRTALLSGLAGSCILFLLSRNVSRLTFGNYGRAYDLALLSITVLFTAVSGGQTALIQGMRRIGDLVKVTVWGGLFGTVLSIPIIYFYGERGIASYLLIVSATGILTSWWYSRKIEVPAVMPGWRDSLSEAKPLLRLGLALMLGWLLTVFTQYALRLFVLRHEGLSAAGVYHASTILATVYVSVILQAMTTDFYPRLSAMAEDHNECRSLINKQVEVGLLLAVPGILATMTLAPWVIVMFYSSKFLLAVDILRWQILGVVLQVVTWPMGFMLRAKGNGKLFFWTELYANIVHLSLAWLGITYVGLSGIGMAFFGMNLFYWILIYWIVRTNYGFTFSRRNVRILSIFALATGVVFLTPYLFYKKLYFCINACITIAIGLYSIKILSNEADTKMIPSFLLKVKTCLGL